MAEYKLSSNPDSIIRNSDGAAIPRGHPWWDEYEVWKAAGNTPDPYQTTAEIRIDAVNRIAAERFNRETAGTTVGGVAVFTDRTTQMKLTAAAIRAQCDSSYTVDWKQSDGTFVTLTAAQLIGIGDAVGDYVQACYSREASLLPALADGTYTDAVIANGWP